MQMYN